MGRSAPLCPSAKLPRGGINGFVGGKIQLTHNYENIISLENLCLAWQEFIVGKKKKIDVIEFSRNLMDNIVELNDGLVNRTYRHGGYKSFYIDDPKRRHIHKASVRDRLLHHAVYRILYPFFDRTFIADSFSCRKEKGMHKAINRFIKLVAKESQNHRRSCWVLKCDIRQFFASIDHTTLFSILGEYISDTNIMRLLENIIGSFNTEGKLMVGLPLGNLTSQLFANVYMNRFDHWVKHRLKVKCYARYADDTVFMSHDKVWLKNSIPLIQNFLQTNLQLSLHPKKILLKTVASGMDFLGWVHFQDHRVLRTKTKQRMMRNIRLVVSEESLQSYLGLLSYGNTTTLRQDVVGEYWLWSDD